MDSGGGRRGEPPRIRVAARPLPIAPPRRDGPVFALPPFLRGCVQHALFAGPMFGLLSALYSYHLSQTGWPSRDAATGHVVRQAQVWHGHMLRAYYITPGENTLLSVLAVPAVLWLILLVGSVVFLGVRKHYARAGDRR